MEIDIYTIHLQKKKTDDQNDTTNKHIPVVCKTGQILNHNTLLPSNPKNVAIYCANFTLRQLRYQQD